MAKLKTIVGVGAIAAAAEYGIARYFFRRTVIRGNAKVERTTKMSGTNWDVYKPELQKRREWLEAQPYEDVTVTSRDNLKLKGKFYPVDGSNKIVICFHGYTSCGMNDYIGLSKFYIPMGFQMLIVDERAHGDSEGTYIGFGSLDRFDALQWIHYVRERFGENCEIYLHGVSMGGATVLMTSGLELPDCVKGIVSDCAFTSAWEVFDFVLRTMYHMPSFPILQIADKMAVKEAGYSLKECSAKEEVKKAKVPILFIHGEADTFVPVRMCREIYDCCASRKDIMTIPGASHAESYYKNTEAYENKIKTFYGLGGNES